MPKVLITGSGRRLGKKLALNFAKSNWSVCLHYNNSEKEAYKTYDEINKLTKNNYIIKSDLRKIEEIKNSFSDLINNFGIPNVLINNSGVFPRKKSLNELDYEEWKDVFDINLNGVFILSKIYSKYIYDYELTGRIINISSIGGKEIWDRRIPYNVSKSALIKLTKVLARDLAPKISVNSVAPGTVLIEDEPSEDSSMIDFNKIPMKRFATADDVFDAVYFFATKSSFITGQCINVDGGYNFSR